jgi:hypothetical protein
MPDRKKVLIITYYWPPAGGPGSQRMVKFAKYLPGFGWSPTIVTVKKGEFPYLDPELGNDIPKTINVYRSKSFDPFTIYKRMTGHDINEPLPVGVLTYKKKNIQEKLLSWIRANFFIPDARIGWIPFIIFYGFNLIRRRKIDLIFSSSPPHSLHLACLILKKLTNIPWIVDFRDPWMKIRYYKSIQRSYFSRIIDCFMEKLVVKYADHITTVSPSLALDFNYIGNIKKERRSSVLPNGYDEADFQNRKSKKISKFLIIHTGNLLENQNPKVLWQSLDNLKKKLPGFKTDLVVRFIGKTHYLIQDSIEKYGLTDCFENRRFIPHHLILEEMINASILLAVIPDIEGNSGIVTGKLFEYIGSGKPICVIGPPDSDAAKIISKISNAEICNYQDITKCKNIIKTWYNDWKMNNLSCSSKRERDSYSRYQLTAKLSEIFYENIK